MAVALGICCSVRPPTAKPQGAQALGKREERAAGQAESQRGEIAEQPLRALGQRHSDGKRRSTRLKPWALFQLIGELSAHRPHPRPSLALSQEARVEKPAENLSRAHITEFRFFAFTHLQ